MKRPNIILINCDDLGYGDLGCYGSKLNRTPHLDQLAQEGIRMTDFYMASAVCSPSRGAMMTGCLPNRIGFDDFDGQWVLFPGMAQGLNPKETTIAKYLKDLGYNTSLVGKWHCGDQKEFLPTRHGFDSYFGIPYSNDMGRQLMGPRRVKKIAQEKGIQESEVDRSQGISNPPLPLLENDEVLQEQPDQAALTERYVQECVRFIKKNQDHPFFLYFAQMYVHLPIYVPQPYLDRSNNGAYGAAVEHIDWSVGVILETLKQLGLEENTLVVFTSDNGSRARDEGGSNAPLRGNKGQTWDGGMRLPCIARWKGTVKPNQTWNHLTASIDLLPTFVELAGGELNSSIAIDGNSFASSLKGKISEHRDEYPFFHRGTLEALRVGDWKLHFKKNKDDCHELYNLRDDLGECNNIFDAHPKIIADINAKADQWRKALGDTSLDIVGDERRPIGEVENPVPLTSFNENYPYYLAEYDLFEGG